MKNIGALVVLAAVMTVACGEPEPDEAVAATERSIELTDPICPAFGCGGNAASLGDGRVFSELNLHGEPNAGGVRLIRARPNATSWQERRIEVRGDRLFGWDPDGMGGWLAVPESQLPGTVLDLQADDGIKYQLVLSGLGQTSFWSWWPGGVQIYEFLVGGNVDQPLCRGVDLPTGEPWGGIRHMALLFEGDRYDPSSKTVKLSEPGDGWFNVACAGTATAKMHLLRHTQAGTMPGHETSVDQRQAMLKLLTADYCGAGRSFTVDGQPLVYRDATTLHRPGPWEGGEVEAVWTSDGAYCLNVPRRAGLDRDEVVRECEAVGHPIPKCTEVDLGPSWEAHGDALSQHRIALPLWP